MQFSRYISCAVREKLASAVRARSYPVLYKARYSADFISHHSTYLFTSLIINFLIRTDHYMYSDRR